MTLAEIVVYPLKGCHGLSLADCAVSRSGLKHDRAFMLNDQNGEPITEKSHPSMSALSFVVSDEDVWAIAPGMPVIDLRSERASSWFGTLLECDCKLSTTTSENQFEAAPLSVVSRQSIAALNFMLARPFDRLRFRPNLIIEAECDAFYEAKWAELQIGAVRLKGAGPCVRPHVLAADLPWSKAHIAGKKATRTAVTSTSGHLIFGAYFCVDVEGKVMVGSKHLHRE